MNHVATAALATIAVAWNSRAVADSFGTGAARLDIEFVTIGNAGNLCDTSGTPNPAGAVEYT
jgi:hypothetical protein